MTLEEKARAQREASKRYRKAHPEKVKAIKAIDTAKQRANKAQRSPSWLSQNQKDDIKEWYYAAQELSKIFPWKLHVDHIVPLRGNNVSGLHVAWNLQLLPAGVNLSKSNKLEEISA
jgi:5-methylcytosine-specific restriction endonuclease McrA